MGVNEIDKSLVWKKVIKQICPRCICRHTYCEFQMFQLSEGDLQEHLTETFSLEKSMWEKPNLVSDKCLLCLGLLQDSFIKVFTDDIIKSVLETPREFESFQLMYSIPPHLNIFQHIFKEKAISILENQFKSTPTEVKVIVKALYDPVIASQLGKCQDNEADGLQISLNFSHTNSASIFLPKISEKRKSKKVGKKFWRKKNLTVVGENKHLEGTTDVPAAATISEIATFIEVTSLESLKEMNSLIDFTIPLKLDVHVFHTAVLIGARYNKYSRELSQTPWFIDGKRFKQYSVEEFIAPCIKDAFKADDYKFSSSGREDVDVRMLGGGRPFIVELINPRKLKLSEEEMKSIEDNINKETEFVKVTCLQVISKSKCELLKEGEEKKKKSYLAKCRFLQKPSQESVDALCKLKDHSEILVQQKTPIRVLHRRSLAIRPKIIHTIELVNEFSQEGSLEFEIKLTTQAGTYIKEFVTGDLGRTSPSLKDFVSAEVDIIDLDVVSIDLNWP